MSRTYAIRGGAGSGVKVGKRDPVSKSHRRVIARKGRALALVVSLVTVAFVTMAGASVMRNRDASSSTTLHQHSSAQSGGWIVPADEVSAPAVPTPGGAQLGEGAFNAVTCSSSTDCVAVGGDVNLNGIAATSSDGGTSWSAASVETGQPEFDAVSCSGTSHCVAVGVGNAATSSDGGATWTSVSIPTPATTLLGVSCPTSTFCVSVGVTPVAAGPYGGDLLVSSDGGSDWSTPQLPAHVSALGSVDCPGANFCIAAGAEILKSDDGGQSWTPEFVNGGTGVLRNVSCTSATQCVAIGPNGQGAGDPSAAAFAVSTTDGGSTWDSVAMPSKSYTLNAIDCSGDGSCVASGPGPNATAPDVVSTDGGSTWSNGTSLPSSVSAVASIACSSPIHCALVGLEGSTPVTGATNDGLTWNVQPVAATATTTTMTGVSQ